MSAMRLKHTPVTAIRNLRRGARRGFALVSAIFLIVILAALGTFMVTLSTVQHTTSTQDLQGTRAYHAARAGIDWGAYQVLRNGNCVGSTPLPLPAATLTGVSVEVLCEMTPHTEGANQVSVYQITSTAKSGTPGSTHYVERMITAAIDTCSGVPCE